METEAYLAGILDGEGCISISRYREKKDKNRGQHKLTVSIGNTSLQLMDWLKDNYGGWVMSKGCRKGLRQNFVWQVSTAAAGELLEMVLPYLIIKQDQAIVALDFQATMRRSGAKGTAKEVLQLRDAMMNAMQKLNHGNFY